ncbi:MAG: hypothetical protein EOP85_18075 [Verrucomicrobiaceae bacterium]|nr:MAG: hypothetical protein EOP85_18075 [Verrucomicrobiaceae bacterium]
MKSGLHARDFTVTELRGKSLAPGAATKIRIHFSPSKTGTRWGAVRITSNDADEKNFDIVLTGKGKTKAAKGGKKQKKKAKLTTRPGKAMAEDVPSPVALKGIEVIDGKKYRTLTLSQTGGAHHNIRDVEVSSDLKEWSSGRKHVTVLIDTNTTFKVRDNKPLSQGNKRHIRVRR